MSRHRDEDPIDRYLDDLLARLTGTSRDIRRTVAECEAHLRQGAERAAVAGQARSQAEQEAIAGFGSARSIAADFNRSHRPEAVRALLPAVTFQACRLSAIGFIAIGVSGVIAWVATFFAGTSSVFADVPGTRYDPASCAHYLAVQPTARTCAAAALLEGRDDALTQRWAAGVVGVLLLASCLWWQRRASRHQGPAPVELSSPAALVGLTLFAVAGLGLTGYGIDRAVINTGAGQWLSAGGVALLVAAGYVVLLWRQVTSVARA